MNISHISGSQSPALTTHQLFDCYKVTTSQSAQIFLTFLLICRHNRGKLFANTRRQQTALNTITYYQCQLKTSMSQVLSSTTAIFMDLYIISLTSLNIYKSLTFPRHISNSLTFPVFQDFQTGGHLAINKCM